MKRSLVSLSLVVLAVALLVGAAQAPPAAALSFAPHVEHPVGGASPYFIAVGDVNANGKADMVTANANVGNNSVSVLLGDGSGGFALGPGSPVAVGLQPEAVAIGEFNSDGNADLATADTGANTVSVLLGNGLGGFAPAVPPAYATAGGPTAIVVADFNGDTFADVATANNAGNATVLLGNGAGVFAPAPGSPFATGAAPMGLVAGDFNGDTFVDLATANQGANTVSVLLGNGLGAFGPPLASPTGNAPFDIATADFDSDGRLDLATNNLGTNTVSALLNTSVGGLLSFAPNVDTFAGAMPWGLAAADFDGDGRPDLATVTGWLPFSSDATVLLGDGLGGFPTVATFDTPDYQAMSIAAGDFNGGKPDLVVGNFLVGANSVSVLRNTTRAKITAVKPAKGKPGATVTITGKGFGDLRGKAKVLFGSKAAGKYVMWSQTKIKVKVPALPGGTVSVKVKTVEGKSNAKSFRVL
jgi:hypothetical protein